MIFSHRSSYVCTVCDKRLSSWSCVSPAVTNRHVLPHTLQSPFFIDLITCHDPSSSPRSVSQSSNRVPEQLLNDNGPTVDFKQDDDCCCLRWIRLSDPAGQVAITWRKLCTFHTMTAASSSLQTMTSFLSKHKMIMSLWLLSLINQTMLMSC